MDSPLFGLIFRFGFSFLPCRQRGAIAYARLLLGSLLPCKLPKINLRYNNQFHVIWEYDPDILLLSTVKLLIQPLLENSIHHGIAPSGRECLIKIKIYQKQEHLYLHIIGIGMTSEQKGSLLSRIADNQTPYQHIGLDSPSKNHELIWLHYIHFIFQNPFPHFLRFAHFPHFFQ